MPCSNRSRLFSQTGTGGYGGQNIIEWWKSELVVAMTSVLSLSPQNQRDCTVNKKKLLNSRKGTTCKQTVCDFVSLYFHSSRVYQISMNQKYESFLEQTFLNTEILCIPQPLIAVADLWELWLGSEKQIACLISQIVIAKQWWDFK